MCDDFSVRFCRMFQFFFFFLGGGVCVRVYLHWSLLCRKELHWSGSLLSFAIASKVTSTCLNCGRSCERWNQICLALFMTSRSIHFAYLWHWDMIQKNDAMELSLPLAQLASISSSALQNLLGNCWGWSAATQTVTIISIDKLVRRNYLELGSATGGFLFCFVLWSVITLGMIQFCLSPAGGNRGSYLAVPHLFPNVSSTLACFKGLFKASPAVWILALLRAHVRKRLFSWPASFSGIVIVEVSFEVVSIVLIFFLLLHWLFLVFSWQVIFASWISN